MVKVLKMSHRFFYVYELKGDIDEIGLFDESPIEIDGIEFNLSLKEVKPVKSIIQHYSFNNQKEIEGNIYFKNRLVPFKIRSGSRLLFLETPFKREKLKVIKFFNNKFNNIEVESFVPTDEEEKDFVCNMTKPSSFKVFIDDKIVRSSDENNLDLCSGLVNNMELIEATLFLSIHNKEITFYYYGNAIQFPHPSEEEIEGVIQTFENTMMAPAK